MSEELTDDEVADRLLHMCYLEEIRELKALNAELLEDLKELATLSKQGLGWLTFCEKVNKIANAAIAKANDIPRI